MPDFNYAAGFLRYKMTSMIYDALFKEIEKFYQDQRNLIKVKAQKDTDKKRKVIKEKRSGKTDCERYDVSGAEVKTGDSG